MSCSSSADWQPICIRYDFGEELYRKLVLTDVVRQQKNAKWEESISLSKQDKLYKDAMETAAVSNETAVAEELLSYFVDIGNKDCFAAMLYVCFDLLRPDVVAELVS
jgi:hypothetical protein